MAQTWSPPVGTDSANTAIKTRLPDMAESLRTLHSGATEPANRVAYMLWADTSSGMLKIRNAGNSAWIEVVPLAQDRRLQLVDPDSFVASLSATRTGKAGVASGAGTVTRLLLLCETASTSSSGNEWQPMLKKYPFSAPGSPVNLFTATVGTFTVLGGVGGGVEFVAHKVLAFTANQNAAFVDADHFELVMTKVGSATTLANFRAIVEFK